MTTEEIVTMLDGREDTEKLLLSTRRKSWFEEELSKLNSHENAEWICTSRRTYKEKRDHVVVIGEASRAGDRVQFTSAFASHAMSVVVPKWVPDPTPDRTERSFRVAFESTQTEPCWELNADVGRRAIDKQYEDERWRYTSSFARIPDEVCKMISVFQHGSTAIDVDFTNSNVRTISNLETIDDVMSDFSFTKASRASVPIEFGSPDGFPSIMFEPHTLRAVRSLAFLRERSPFRDPMAALVDRAQNGKTWIVLQYIRHDMRRVAELNSHIAEIPDVLHAAECRNRVCGRRACHVHRRAPYTASVAKLAAKRDAASRWERYWSEVYAGLVAPKKGVYVIVTTTSTEAQWAERVRLAGLGTPVMLRNIKGRELDVADGSIVIGSYQMLWSRELRIAHPVRLVVSDEFDAKGSTPRPLLLNCDVEFRILMSATPFVFFGPLAGGIIPHEFKQLVHQDTFPGMRPCFRSCEACRSGNTKRCARVVAFQTDLKLYFAEVMRYSRTGMENDPTLTKISRTGRDALKRVLDWIVVSGGTPTDGAKRSTTIHEMLSVHSNHLRFRSDGYRHAVSRMQANITSKARAKSNPFGQVEDLVSDEIHFSQGMLVDTIHALLNDVVRRKIRKAIIFVKSHFFRNLIKFCIGGGVLFNVSSSFLQLRGSKALVIDTSYFPLHSFGNPNIVQMWLLFVSTMGMLTEVMFGTRKATVRMEEGGDTPIFEFEEDVSLTEFKTMVQVTVKGCAGFSIYSLDSDVHVSERYQVVKDFSRHAKGVALLVSTFGTANAGVSMGRDCDTVYFAEPPARRELLLQAMNRITTVSRDDCPRQTRCVHVAVGDGAGSVLADFNYAQKQDPVELVAALDEMRKRKEKYD